MLLGRRHLRDLGPLDWLALAVAVLAMAMNTVALFGWRPSFEASRSSRLILLLNGTVLLVWGIQRLLREARNPGLAGETSTARNMLLVSLSLTCGALSLLLGPR